MGKSKKPQVPRQPSIKFEDFEEADRVFRASLEGPAYVPVRGSGEPSEEVRGGHLAQKRARDKDRAKVIDLHGLTLQQAKEFLDDRLSRLMGAGALTLTVKIVTGKGLHSGPGGAVLAKEIHRHVEAVYAKWIVSLEASPADVAIRGVPLRGHFCVKLRKA